MALLSIAGSPCGHLGSLFERRLCGADALPLPKFAKCRIHAPAAARVAYSPKVPLGVLKHANDIWHHGHPDLLYGCS